ncbi:hypothetical protein W97_07751 [Coniosporium apollinis CBS 100218]|uniref:Uncharacterized protein n=1 Tax=Coniosporium apollinis (strain CBS 100218) TaxID=1168221 RepID=R7Z2N4_CONA1|nr:uncharacterized protein W97_07751 [Coniosporium apollinis CBS 100218]EON68427.1 hypothetical protein W97_07751 [Coniosporium apollinis CBS 100218]
MPTISEIAARLEEANARAFNGRRLDRAAAERLKLMAEEGNVRNAADELEIDLNEGNIGPEADEVAGTVHLDAEGRTYGMTNDEAQTIAKFEKSCKKVEKTLKEGPLWRPTSQDWWAKMRTKLRQGEFREVREEIYGEMQKYSKHTVAGEVDYVLSLQQVYDRI